jgi:6-phosphogluconolactonase
MSIALVSPHRVRLLLAALASMLVIAGTSATNAMAAPGAVFTTTNDPAGNVVQKFDRAADGSLTAAGSFATGGVGLAGLGGRQGAVELSDDEAFVYSINAGSNSVTTFRVTGGGLALVGSVPSGGAAPVSVDERDGLVYVLNSGGTPNVSTFTSGVDGTLTPLPGGQRDLNSGAAGAAQVSVAPDGSSLVVTERVANRLETLALDGARRPGTPVVTQSSGAVPFGFAFGHRGDVIVSEAGASTVSSYRIGAGGLLGAITASAPVNQGAACWLAVSPNGLFAYTGNASGSISGYGIGSGGSLSALDADGITAALPTTTPRDLDFARNGRFLYAVSPAGRVIGFRVATDGSLTQVTSAPAAGAGITGAAAA